MIVKRILLYFPLILIVVLVQSFFWVPTYDNQAVGNPARLVKYIHGSAADAQILNPILSADTTSSSINNLVFDGLIDLDDKLEYRPRLASSWTQFEEAYLAFNEDGGFPAPGDLLQFIRKSLAGNEEWSSNIRSVEILPPHVDQGEINISRQ